MLQYQTSLHCAWCNKIVKRGAEILPNADTRIPDGIKLRKRSKAVVFCSGRCRDALGWLPMRKLCEGCGQPYYATTRSAYMNGRFCTDACREQVRSIRRYQEYKATRPARLCKHCGDALPDEWQFKHGYRYCSDGCKCEAERLRKQMHKQKPIAVEIGWLGTRKREVDRLDGRVLVAGD